MQSALNIMVLIIFAPVVYSIIVLFMRVHEMPKGNKALDPLLEEMSRLERKKKEESEKDKVSDNITENTHAGENRKNEISAGNTVAEDIPDTVVSDPQPLSDEELDLKRAKENAAALFGNKPEQNAPDPEKLRKEAAADKVMRMMAASKKTGLSDADLRKMVDELSDRK